VLQVDVSVDFPLFVGTDAQWCRCKLVKMSSIPGVVLVAYFLKQAAPVECTARLTL
jgi:hypothetical protein